MKNKKIFYLRSGKTFSSLKSFAKELKKMSNEVYSNHVTPLKNDFSNWIEHSLEEKELSKKISGHITKIETELEVLRHLVERTEKKKKK